jgi:hypothetical protein
LTKSLISAIIVEGRRQNMIMKKRVWILCLLPLLGMALYAHGAKDVEEKNATNLDSWQESFDLTGKKAGKYNIIITAKDLGGNTAVEGPYNIYVDPKSDLPVCGITNPHAGMRVVGNLNIVGTCVDDDGVDHVDLVLDGDEEHPVRAQGKEFWSYYLDTHDLPEGPHSVKVTGTDINGLAGNSVSLTWNLDRRQPVTAIDNYTMGTLVSGSVTLKGQISDGNGVKALSYSLDNGKTFEPTKISENKKEGFWTFAVPVNTKKYPDGPSVIWFKAVDNAGSSGMYSFLYFIDNTNPDVKIVYPEEKSAQNGRFAVAGIARDTLGITKLSWTFGTQSGDCELVAGNPYWCVALDSSALKTKSEKFTISATDLAGNTIHVSRTIDFNQEADKPVVTLSEPAADTLVSDTGDAFIRGIALDDDGVASVKYSLDGGEEVSADTKGVFCGVLARGADLKAGKHTVKAYAVDVNGVAGNPVTVVFTAQGAVPAFDAPKIINGKDTADAGNGTMIHPEAGSSFMQPVTSSCGINHIRWTVTSGTETAAEHDEDVKNLLSASAVIPIGANIAARGVVTAEVTATDIYGRTSSHKTLLYIFNNTVVKETLAPEDPPAEDSGSGVKLAFQSVNDEPYTRGMKIVIPAKLTASISSPVPLQSAAYEITGEKMPGGNPDQKGTVKLIKSAEDPASFTAEIPLANIPSGITTVRLTVAGGTKAAPVSEQTSAVFLVVRSSEGLHIEDDAAVYAVNDEKNGSCVFYANVPLPISAVPVTQVPGVTITTEGNCITAAADADGEYKNVAVKVTDGSGKTYTSKPVTITKDTSGPEVHIETPALYAWAKNAVTVAGTAADPSGIKTIEYSIDGGASWNTITQPKKTALSASFTADVSLKGMSDGLVRIDVRATDGAGRESYARTAVYRDVTPPDVQVVLPLAEDVVNGDNLIVFSAKDTAGIDKAYYVSPPVGKARTQTRNQLDIGPLITTHIGTEKQPIDEAMSFEFTDLAGNTATVESWKFTIDSQSDLPRAEIHLPEDNEVITRDFTVSGVVYDDDGASTIFYKIDNGAYTQLSEPGTSYSIDVPITKMTDNEHTVTVYAVDVNGVKGPETVRKFRVSLEEPKGAVTEPVIDTSVKEFIQIKGNASDKNGIALVQVSLDNGNTYNDAEGKENWVYNVDTRAIPDGTQVVFIKITDNYGIIGLYSSLINIDNIKPNVALELPLDDSKTTGNLFFSGYAFDNVGITDMYITVRSLEQKTVAKKLSHIQMLPDRIITQTVDISSLDNGFYNIELTGTDKAGNVTRVSRNIELDKSKPLASVDLLYPLDGEHKQGVFNLYGQASSEKKITGMSLYIDDKKAADAQLSAGGFFCFTVTPDLAAAGVHSYYVAASVEGANDIPSRKQKFTYSPSGPWVKIDNFTYGDFATGRPYIIGTAGYSIDQDEVLSAKTKEATAEQKKAVAEKKVALVELSLDNGKTFVPVSQGEKWRYRIENQDLTEGYHFLFVRATMKNGETAVTRTIVQIDNTKPSIHLISPGAGGRYNQVLEYSGLSSDEVGLDSVKLSLRKGDKASYEVPSFIQGLYFDWHFWGATLFDMGVGLTFFDDNVKVQFQWGQFTQAQRDIFDRSEMRYGGDNVMGIKILANVGHLPFSYFFGHDWEWLSASFAIGADFTRFNETNSGRAQVLSALLGQIEFPRVTLPNVKRFRTFSLYTEGSLWFIPTDVSGTISIQNLVPQIAEGIRLNVF